MPPADSSPWPASPVLAAAREPLGTRARRLFVELGIAHTRRDPGHKLAHLQGVPFLIDLVRLTKWWWQTSGRVAREIGVPRLRQFIEICRFTWPEKLHGQLYYMFELYRPEEQARRGEYLTRWETKNGLIRELRRHLVPRTVRSDLGNKVAFTQTLLEHGLPGIPILLVLNGGRPTPGVIDPANFRRDLFTKLRAGKGAQGAGLIKYLGEDLYRYQNRELSFAELIAQLTEQSKTDDLIVLPRLHNHPAIAGLAEETLMAVRIFTCVNERNEPEPVFAMLRILGKLEPRWNSITEWAASVNLQTGELGILTGDVPESFTIWSATHPVTGHQVEGLQLPYWEKIRGIVIEAHKLANDRFLVGWDIAITPAGPFILEGNALPDFIYPQRVQRQPFGQSRLGQLLHYHLDRLEPKLRELKHGRKAK
ncbi:MAG: sugar-transfer associated ATP-grasp domain-containing protein [Dongiaceae bacterium]